MKTKRRIASVRKPAAPRAPKVRQLDVLLAFDLKIARARSLDRLLTLLADETRALLNADRCTVFLYDKRRKELWSRVGHGIRTETIRVSKDDGLVGAAFTRRKLLNVPDAYRDRRFSAETDQKTGYRTKSVLAVPMWDTPHKEALGVFQVLNKKSGAFNRHDELLLTVLADHAAAAVENAQLYDELKRAQEETVFRLGLMAEYRDPKDTAGHLKRMSRYSALIAREMGWSAEDSETLRLAASLHDIGKVATPDAVLMKTHKLSETQMGGVELRLTLLMERLKLTNAASAEVEEVAGFLRDVREANKPSSTAMPEELIGRIRAIAARKMADSEGREIPLLREEEVSKLTIRRGNLTPEERREMEQHTLYGAKMVENAESALLRLAEVVSRAHHEKFDGTGYPAGLKGEVIPLAARIVALADVVDALLSKRVYKPGWGMDEVLDFVRRESGKHFDPAVVEAFFSVLPEIKRTMAEMMEQPDVPVR